jgi:hypothetical protein
MTGEKPAATGRNKTAQELAEGGAPTRQQENRLGGRARALFEELAAEIGVPTSEILKIDVKPGENGTVVVEVVDRDELNREAEREQQRESARRSVKL